MSRKKLEYLKSTVISCGELKGAAQADIDEIFAHKSPSNRLGKCIEACVIEAGGIVSRFFPDLKMLKPLIYHLLNVFCFFCVKMKNNQVDPDGVESLTLTVYGDENYAKKAKEVANDCVGVTDENPCEAGYKILQCLHDKAKAKGVSMDDD